MPTTESLTRIFDSLTSDRLADLLRVTDRKISGRKSERVKRLAKALNNGEAELFPDLLKKLDGEELRSLAETAELNDEGGRGEIQKRLSRWFGGESGGEREEPKNEESSGEWYAADTLSFDYDPHDAKQPLYPFQKDVFRELKRKAYPPEPGARFVIPIATGGGKTRVANDWIWKVALANGKRVLWVTKDWELLRQASSDLTRRFEDAHERIARIGGKSHLGELDEDPDADLVYTTIHTWHKRRKKKGLKKSTLFDYVFIDEVHWGEGGKLYGDLHEQYDSHAAFVGLTATPREWSDYEPVGEGYGFFDLVEKGFLSEPKFREIETEMEWNPERAGGFGDFTGTSLSALATSPKRNRVIADTYEEKQRRYGKTLVFACDIDHAKKLAKIFEERGVAAAALHSKLNRKKRHEYIRRFRGLGDNEPLDVLVNIAMMTHGIDIPDIQTIFLARPTASKTLFSQMVGRGARRIPGKKDTFRVVDFVDNVEEHEDALVDWREVFGIA